MTNSNQQIVTIVGGGASAHVLVPFLSGAGYEVRLLTRRPQDWSADIGLRLLSADTEVLRTFHGSLTRVSSDPAEVVPQSDFVVLCMPVHTYRLALDALAPSPLP